MIIILFSFEFKSFDKSVICIEKGKIFFKAYLRFLWFLLTLFLNDFESYISFFQISPVGLIILSVVSFRWCRFSEMFDWSTHSGYLYLPSWVREIGAMMQLLPLLLVPFVGVIQSCRYFLNGQGPLHERINLLYRPSYEAYTNRWVKFMEEISIKSKGQLISKKNCQAITSPKKRM